MQKERLSIIAAIGKDTRALGKNNDLLWKIPADLRRFKELTTGHPIIMGSNTYISIGRPLPLRTNIVLSDDASFAPDGIVVARTLSDARTLAEKEATGEIFIIGGGSVYTQALPIVDRMYITIVDDDTPGDVYFPEYASLPFKETERETHTHDTITFSFVTYDRVE